MTARSTPVALEALMSGAREAFDRGFGGVIEIAPDGATSFYIDGRGDEVAVIQVRPCEPDCMWRSPATTLSSVFQRKRALESAYLSGRLVVGGDMSVMARLILKGK